MFNFFRTRGDTRLPPAFAFTAWLRLLGHGTLFFICVHNVNKTQLGHGASFCIYVHNVTKAHFGHGASFCICVHNVTKSLKYFIIDDVCARVCVCVCVCVWRSVQEDMVSVLITNQRNSRRRVQQKWSGFALQCCSDRSLSRNISYFEWRLSWLFLSSSKQIQDFDSVRTWTLPSKSSISIIQ
jgi:hypothetical protein